MYEGCPNFGDVLNKHVWPRYFGPLMERNDDVLLFGIGTLLGDEIEHEGRVIVCGSGCGYRPNTRSAVQARWNVFFVRGPISAKLLGLPEDRAITDPALLVSEFIEPAPPSGRTVFIPHWETSANPLWRRACALADIDYIDPLADVHQIVARLSSARLVLAEAMHGAIVADAYRVPWVPVSTSRRVNRFKWRDWTTPLELVPTFGMLSPLGASDIFRSLTSDAKTERVLRETLREGGTDIAETGHELGGGLERLARLLQSEGLSAKTRSRIAHSLLWRVGPRVDRLLGLASDAGWHMRQLERAALELRNLAQGPGYRSNDAVAATLRARTHERLQDVRTFLG
jgi:succinoglycan biosynthesis protein ExoV